MLPRGLLNIHGSTVLLYQSDYSTLNGSHFSSVLPRNSKGMEAILAHFIVHYLSLLRGPEIKFDLKMKAVLLMVLRRSESVTRDLPLKTCTPLSLKMDICAPFDFSTSFTTCTLFFISTSNFQKSLAGA